MKIKFPIDQIFKASKSAFNEALMIVIDKRCNIVLSFVGNYGLWRQIKFIDSSKKIFLFHLDPSLTPLRAHEVFPVRTFISYTFRFPKPAFIDRHISK